MWWPVTFEFWYDLFRWLLVVLKKCRRKYFKKAVLPTEIPNLVWCGFFSYRLMILRKSERVLFSSFFHHFFEYFDKFLSSMYSHIELPFKFFDKIVSKIEFLTIINLYKKRKSIFPDPQRRKAHIKLKDHICSKDLADI